MKTTLITIIGALIAGNSAFAAVIYLDTFNTVNSPTGINAELGAPRQSGTSLPLAGQRYTVVQQNLTSTVGIEGNQLLISGERAQGLNTAWSDGNWSSVAGTKYTVSADFHFLTFDGDYSNSVWGGIACNETQSSEIVAGLDLMLLFRRNGTLLVYANGEDITPDYTLAPANDGNVTLAIDETKASPTFDLVFGGVTIASNLAYAPGGAARYMGLRFYTYDANNYQMKFDNFTINVVPEPATLGLLAVGMGMMLRRKRD